jgi:hypothetical protein
MTVSVYTSSALGLRHAAAGQHVEVVLLPDIRAPPQV